MSIMSVNLGQAIAKDIIANGINDTVAAYVVTSSTTPTVLRATAYTEPSSAQQMRLVSSSTNDSSAGTGSRTIRITYYDDSMNGPFIEDVTMNGLIAVNTVATNVRFIESIVSLTIGSNGTNVGTISLQNTLGTTTFGTIAVGDGRTYWGHHYVGVDRKCFIERLILGCTGNNGLVMLRSTSVLTANSFDKQFTSAIRVVNAQPSQVYDMSPIYINGPCRLTLYWDADSATAATCYATMIIVDV